MSVYEPLDPAVEESARQVVDCALTVHRKLGPGLIEGVYEACLCHELRKRGIAFAVQDPVPIVYDGERLDTVLRPDVLVNNHLIVELKSVEALLPIHEAQTLTYLRITGLRLALLINFNVIRIKEGIRRLIL